jgi:hypothetical protein
MSLKSAEELVPSTFAERGIAVPFTTPLLSQSRLRQDRNERFEFLLPNFTGGRGIYVMPWKSLPSVMTITLHDRLLFEAIEGEKSHSPETIRRASLTVQASGVAGGDAAATAKRALAEDDQFLVLTQFVLVTELLKLVGMSVTDLMKPGMTAEQTVRTARQSLGKVAQLVKITPEEMGTRVETLGTALAPVGLPQSSQLGRLRTLMRRLGSFRSTVDTWSEIDVSDAAMLGRYAASVSEHTLALCRQRLDQLDRVCAQPKQAVHDEPRFRAAVVQHVDRLSWLLDGWEYIVALWDSVIDKPGEPQQTAIAEIYRLIPMVPKEEAVWSVSNLDPEMLNKIQRRWVRTGEDWRTGALDMEAVMRVEQLKSAMA